MFANDMPGSSAVSACLAGLSFPAYEVIPCCEGHSVAASAVPAVGCKAWATNSPRKNEGAWVTWQSCLRRPQEHGRQTPSSPKEPKARVFRGLVMH